MLKEVGKLEDIFLLPWIRSLEHSGSENVSDGWRETADNRVGGEKTGMDNVKQS